jgi:hypothetical protein
VLQELAIKGFAATNLELNSSLDKQAGVLFSKKYCCTQP